MSRRLHFLTLCLVRRFVRAECFRAFVLLNPLNSSQDAAGHKDTKKKEKEMLRNWFYIVSFSYFSSLSLAASSKLAFPSLPEGAVFSCYLLMRCITSSSICPTSCSPLGFAD